MRRNFGQFPKGIMTRVIAHAILGTTQLENAGGSQLTVTRSLDDIYSESVTVRSSLGSATIQEFDIPASDGVIFGIDTVL